MARLSAKPTSISSDRAGNQVTGDPEGQRSAGQTEGRPDLDLADDGDAVGALGSSRLTAAIPSRPRSGEPGADGCRHCR